MKIIQICAAYKPAYIYGGPTMSVSKLAEELVKAGQDVTVLATTANGSSELEVPTGKAQEVDGVKVFYFKRLTKDHTHFSPALLIYLHRLILAEKKVGRKELLVVHIHAWWNLVSIFSCWIAKLHGVKVVLSPRGMLTRYSLTNRNSKIKDSIHFVLGKSLLKYCHIHATSSKEKRDVAHTAETNGFSIIPNFVRFPKEKTINLVASDTYRLLFLSRVEEKKGLELLFEALSKTTIRWHLNIAGKGSSTYCESLKRLAEQFEIDSFITWLGQVNNKEKFDLIAQHDLLVLTSYNENFANVVIESLAMGTPVLLSEEVGLANYVEENDLGWISNLKVLEIVSTLESSFHNLAKRAQIRLKAPNVIARDFNEATLLNSYIHMYKQLIS